MNIYRNSTLIHVVEIDAGTIFTNQLMGEHKINSEWVSMSPLDLRVGDYTEWKGEKYYLNMIPAVTKVNNITYNYSAVFEGEIYTLYNKIIMHLEASKFTYYGGCVEFLGSDSHGNIYVVGGDYNIMAKLS